MQSGGVNFFSSLREGTTLRWLEQSKKSKFLNVVETYQILVESEFLRTNFGTTLLHNQIEFLQN